MDTLNNKCPFYSSCNHRDCNTFCLKYYKSNYYFNCALIPENRRFIFPLRIDSDGRDEKAFVRLSEISKNIDEFVEKGNNLYIYSSIAGNGKSSLALSVVQL